MEDEVGRDWNTCEREVHMEFWDSNLRGRDILEDQNCTNKDNIEVDPIEIKWEGGERLHLGQVMDKWWALVNISNEPLDCIQYCKFVFSENILSAFGLFYLHPENFNKILSITEHTETAEHNKSCMETYSTISYLWQDIGMNFRKVTSLKYLNMWTYFVHW